MPVINRSQSIAANLTVDNLLSGSAFEFLAFNASCDFGVVASATGLVVTILSGSDVILEESPISTANRFPIFPDDFPVSDVAAAGERLIVRVRNTTAGALTIFLTVRINPV